MFVMQTDGDVIPYDKQGKDFEVEPSRKWWTSARGFLDRNNATIHTGHMVITIVLTIVTIVLAILYRNTP